MQHIVFRVDATIQLATGHLMRCLTIAAAFRSKHPKLTITFLTGKLPAYSKQLLANTSYNTIEFEHNADAPNWKQELDIIKTKQAIESLNTPVDLLIVDHYFLDISWEKAISPLCNKLLVIDDLANREHYCDYLLDQTYARSPIDYLALTPSKCQLLLGQSYMLLRNEFEQKISAAKIKRSKFLAIQHILLSLGGMDPENATGILLSTLLKIKKSDSYQITALISSDAPHLSKVKKIIENRKNVTLLINCKDMAKQILKADIAIGACGGTTWERCSLGLPTVAVVLAENQRKIAVSLHYIGAHYNLGDYQCITVNELSEALDKINDTKHYQTMVSKCFSCCDAKGANRLVGKITQNNITLVEADIDDLDITYQWQSNPLIRQYSRNPKPVTFLEHQQWFTHSLTLDTRFIYVIYYRDKPAGVLRLDLLKEQISHQLCTKNENASIVYANYEVSILVDPLLQGKGIAQQALTSIPKQYMVQGLYAYVNHENNASQKLFSHANFIRMGPESFIHPARNSRSTC